LKSSLQLFSFRGCLKCVRVLKNIFTGLGFDDR